MCCCGDPALVAKRVIKRYTTPSIKRCTSASSKQHICKCEHLNKVTKPADSIMSKQIYSFKRKQHEYKRREVGCVTIEPSCKNLQGSEKYSIEHLKNAQYLRTLLFAFRKIMNIITCHQFNNMFRCTLDKLIVHRCLLINV